MNKGSFGFPQNTGNSSYQMSGSPGSAPLPMAPLQSPHRRLDAGPVGFPNSFRPPLISGCLLWMDAADDSVFTFSSGSLVSQWRDKSGNNNHFSQATENYQPVRDRYQNGLMTVRQRLDSGLTRAAVSHSNCTIFQVSRISTWSPTSGRDLFCLGGNGGIGIVPQVNAALRVGYVCQFVAFVQAPVYATPTGFVLYTLTRSGTTNTLYVNGSVAMSATTSMNSPSGTAYLMGSPAGGVGANFNNFSEVAEVVFYNSALSNQNRITVEQYLRRKWAIIG